MPPTRYPNVPYLQARGFGGTRPVTQVIVIHATDNTANARAEATYAGIRTDQVSAHFYIDDNDVVQAVPLDQVAWGCLHSGNQISVQLELCGLSNGISDATMRRAAPVVSWLLNQYGIPAIHYGPGQAAAVATGTRGVAGHDTITAAFPQDHGDHTDPGPRFPWPVFMGYVQGGDAMNLSDTVTAAGQRKSVQDLLADPWAVIMTGRTEMGPGTDSWLVRELEAIKAAVTQGLTDTQIATIAARLVASESNGLSPADHDAIVADVKAALRSGVGP